jgi:Zn-dependent protease with chaperone function
MLSNQPIDVLLFGQDLPAAGLPTRCQINDDAIKLDYQQLTIVFTRLSADVGGFDHNQLQLHWQDNDDGYMLIPADVAGQKALRAALPAHAVKGLKGWHSSTKSQSMVWNSVLYGAGLLVLSAILVVWQYDRVLTFAANQVSIETEKKLGDSVLKSISGSENFLKEGVAVDAVKNIGTQLTAGSRYKYQWYVLKDDAINAFAAPGGIIVVNSGLLKKAEPNELAAVLAHEVQHVEQRHSLKNMLHAAGVGAVVLLVLGDANAVMMILAQQVSQQYFSRKVEADADLKGAQLLTKKQIDASGMPSFFKKMAAEYKDKDNTPEWLSSHPETLERIKSAEAYVAANPCKSCVPLTWDKTKILADLGEDKELGDDFNKNSGKGLPKK